MLLASPVRICPFLLLLVGFFTSIHDAVAFSLGVSAPALLTQRPNFRYAAAMESTAVLTARHSMRLHAEAGKEEPIFTPSCPEENPQNFGPASTRDSTVFTCGRPGGDPADKDTKIPTQAVVDEWVEFMTTSERQIKHVVILLSDEELEAYEEPGLIAAYEAAGIVVHHIPLASENSYQAIMTDIDQIEAKGERVVAHCTHGVGRSGRVAAGVSRNVAFSSSWYP